jgi:(p)ppGpp synthase/HD superfamily hydrolase
MKDIKDAIRDLDLKTMDPALLALSLQGEAERLGFDKFTFELALQVAAFGHRDQTRANRGDLPRDNYITHPLRNALRLIRYGVTDQDIILAAILHDVIEDCWKTITKTILGEQVTEVEKGQAMTYGYLDEIFGSNVAFLVTKVTNPSAPDGASKIEKRRLYAVHVGEAVSDPKAFLVKFSDFVDNAVGLSHNSTDANNKGMVQHLATKYLPLVQIFEDNLTEDVLKLITPDGEKQLREHLRQGLLRLAHLKAGPAHV